MTSFKMMAVTFSVVSFLFTFVPFIAGGEHCVAQGYSCTLCNDTDGLSFCDASYAGAGYTGDCLYYSGNGECDDFTWDCGSSRDCATNEYYGGCGSINTCEDVH